MAENTFKSPGFFEQEIELTAEKQQPTGVPAGIIGAAQMGPAFVPLTLGTFKDFENRFGTLTPEKFAPYAVREWLKNRQSVTFCRVLGAGANATQQDFSNTRNYGFAKNAGFKAVADPSPAVDSKGAVQFIGATHVISANSDIGFPIFTDNDTFLTQNSGLKDTFNSPDDDDAKIIRAMIINAKDHMIQVATAVGQAYTNETTAQTDGDSTSFAVKLTRDTAEREMLVSLDPDHTKYIGKVLNTDPKKFQEEGHLLWLDFAIEKEVAHVASGKAIEITRGDNTQLASGDIYDYLGSQGYSGTDLCKQQAFGLFNARYQAPKTTSFISQPFGKVEYDLFHFECLSDGHVANESFKVSIANVRKSTDPNYEYGTFDVLVRVFGDSDFNPQVIERFVGLSMDPAAENFIGRKIGDKKVVYDFDADLAEERRLVISGRYPNQSLNIRVVLNDAIYSGQVPKSAVPFGFRGLPTLKTAGMMVSDEAVADASLIPPIPFTFKATKGKVKFPTSENPIELQGAAGDNERADARIYFGVKTTRVEAASIAGADTILQPNLSSRPSKLVRAYTKLMGLAGADLDTGMFVSDADAFNDNKFTLARVALGKQVVGESNVSESYDIEFIDDLGSATALMKSACYIRNGEPDPATYAVKDNYNGNDVMRVSFASLIHDKTANNFNKFSKYAKFTNIFSGGWDGLNILDEDIEDLNDRAASSEGGSLSDGSDTGKAAGNLSSTIGDLGLVGTDDGSMMGKGKDNNVIASYRQAINIMTDPMTVRTNILAIPGIRDPYVADYAAGKVRDYSMAMYVMDVPNYNGGQYRIFDTGSRPDVEYTANNLEGRAIDNNYVASYFPDVFITDPINNRRVLVPASIAALGALGYSDNVSYPWFAPAGFNRGALDFVENVRTRLSVSDRDDLYERRINPIANFPNGGFVIFGQKTMQINQSALDRVNVRRLLLEVKRQVVEVANVVLFEQNTPQTRARFVNLVQPRLALIQAQAGIEKFRVICDDTNNTPADAEENRLNGKIVLIPTRTIEFIAIDFIITNAGVSFE